MEAVENPSKAQAGGCSQAPAAASKSQDPDARIRKEASITSGLPGFGGSVENTRENGVRVSINGKESLGGGLVETEISVEKSLGGQNIVVSGAKEGGLADSEMRGVSSLLKMRGSVREIEVKHGSQSESVKGSASVLVDKNEEMRIENENEVAGDGICSADGVSLVVDIGGEIAKIDEKESGDFGEEENDDSLNENGEDPDGDIEQTSENEEGEGEDTGNEDYEFCVGDVVWGKIRSHPWWPGQIYDPLDASDYALKVKLKDRLLVAYFGDGTFAWCHPSQLKPFEENFEEMSKQSNSKNFVNAVQNAVDEIGRLVELRMTCSCVPKENLIGLGRPLAANGGIKKGVFVPDGGIGKLTTALFEPAELLAEMKYITQVVSMTNVLEFTVVKSWLLAFYRAKGGYQLPMYYEPKPIPGLEDDTKSYPVDASDYKNTVEIPIQGPIEGDWLSSPVTPKFGQTSQTLLQKCPGNSEDKLHQRRKQKSIAEIMEEDVDAEAKVEEGDVGKVGTNSAKPALSSGRKKRKGSDEANGDGGNNLTFIARKRKETKLSGSFVATETKVSSVDNDGSGAKEKVEKGPLTRGRKKNKGSSVENDGDWSKDETIHSPVPTKRKTNLTVSVQSDDGETKEQIDMGSSPRERKKSKYLSPPYTILNWRQSKREIEAESPKVSSEARIGERMTRASGHDIGSPPTLKCSGETFQKKQSGKLSTGNEASGYSSPRTPKPVENVIIDSVKVKAPANEVLSEIRSAALNPQSLEDNNSLDMVEGFLSIFRSFVYRNGSNYKMYNKHKPVRERKSLESEPGSLGKNHNQTDLNSRGHKSQQRKIRKNEEVKSDKPKLPEEAKSNKPKLQQAGRASDKKTNGRETDEKASPAALYVTFGPGSSLPSKDDLIRIYGKYGALNNEETDMYYNNFCAQVVFLRSSDAEDAFNDSQLASPFEGSSVTFRLRYLSAALKTRELREIPYSKPSPTKDGGKTTEKPSASRSSIGETSQLNYIRQKLETMTSMVDMSGGKMSPEMKSKLESEIKGLLEKVSTMGGSSS